ncbi:MAG: DUF4340 domain-containing protein [Verrucomicrobiae bacterium]|jgi:hypothetical protein|nr:DUF4340 domain-containing protein [Verrucomicrobiae bacterium]
MTRRGTIALFVLAFATISWFLFADLPHQQSASDGPIFHLDPEKVTRIVITDGNDTHTLQREEDAWSISTTPPDRVSDKKIVHLLTIAAELKPLNILNPKELKHTLSLSSLGLQNPKRSLTIHQEGAKDQTLFIGNEAASDKSLFAQFEKQKTVMIIPSEIATIAFLNADSFRDPYLTTLKLDALKEITVTRGRSQLSLKKENEKWVMTQPISGIISSEALQSWIAPLFTTQVLKRVGNDDPNNLSTYGLDQPRATISLLAEDVSQPVTLSLGNVAEDLNTNTNAPPCYLCSSDRHAIFIAPPSLSQLFMITPETLRDRQLFELNLDTVDRIEITTLGKTLSLHRQLGGSEDWILDNQTILPKATVEKMLEMLEKTKILSYQVATPSQAALAGLDDSSQPTSRIRFIAHLSENTPDEQAGDHTVLEISFGQKIGERIFARIGKEPELLEVPAQTVDILNLKT